MHFHDDLDYPGDVDYEALDAANRAEDEDWLNRLPWMTGGERTRYALANHPEFPGACASGQDYDTFAVRLRRASQRQVPCVFDMDWGKVRGAFDLVSGATYLLDDGQYVLGEELPDTVTVRFADEPRAVLYRIHLVQGFANVHYVETTQDTDRVTSGELLAAEARRVPVDELGRVVEQLAKAHKLPPVTASVNWKRFNTYHPL